MKEEEKASTQKLKSMAPNRAAFLKQFSPYIGSTALVNCVDVYTLHCITASDNPFDRMPPADLLKTMACRLYLEIMGKHKQIDEEGFILGYKQVLVAAAKHGSHITEELIKLANTAGTLTKENLRMNT
jgi:hypothetical protein